MSDNKEATPKIKEVESCVVLSESVDENTYLLTNKVEIKSRKAVFFVCEPTLEQSFGFSKLVDSQDIVAYASTMIPATVKNHAGVTLTGEQAKNLPQGLAMSLLEHISKMSGLLSGDDEKK